MTRKSLARVARIAVLLWAPQTSFAAEDDAASQLTGGSSREWVYQRIVRTMGPSDSCSSGETYSFSKDRTLTIRQCLNGHIVTAQHKWSVATTSAADVVLTIDTSPPYLLIFRDASEGRHFMRFRTKNESQTEPVVDKEFKLNEE